MEASAQLIDTTSYEVPRPKVDGQGANRIVVGFGGSVQLDWRIENDVEFVEGLDFGSEVELVVMARVERKGFTSPDDPAYGVGLKVHSIVSRRANVKI